MSDFITAAALKELAAAGTVRAVVMVPTGNGFALRAKVGMTERTLRPFHHNTPRLFASLMAAAKFVRQDLRLARMEVELANWQPKQRGM